VPDGSNNTCLKDCNQLLPLCPPEWIQYEEVLVDNLFRREGWTETTWARSADDRRFALWGRGIAATCRLSIAPKKSHDSENEVENEDCRVLVSSCSCHPSFHESAGLLVVLRSEVFF
jgi:hypothetical protein